MRKSASKSSPSASSQAILSRKSWTPLPAIALLAGKADFFKREIIRRFTKELFGSGTPEVRRFPGPSERNLDELPLSTVLDELRTPSFFSPRRLVIVERGSAFVAAHRDVLEGCVANGFGGGHLIITLEDKAALRTKFAKAVAATGWLVTCDQPYDRPPPWETGSPAWDSGLSHWVVQQARKKNLSIDPRTAFVLHDRVGTDLAVLDEELEKISTFLGTRESSEGKARRTVTRDTILAVTGETREDSLFAPVDLILEGRRREAVEALDRLFERGYHAESGAFILDPRAIAPPLMGALIRRLRALRRGHAMSDEGATSDDWIREKLVQRPFLPRFQRQLRATSAARIRRLLHRLYRIDRSIKLGGDAHRLLVLLASE